MRSGGGYVDLRGQSWDEAFAILSGRPFCLLGVDAPAGALRELYPAMARVVDGLVTVSGKLTGDGPVTLTLKYGFGTKVWKEQEVAGRPSNWFRSAASRIPTRRSWPTDSEPQGCALLILRFVLWTFQGWGRDHRTPRVEC